MTTSRALLAFSLALGASLLARTALADVPGPREECDADEKAGCEVCWQHYGGAEGEEDPFKKCSDPLVAKGFHEACRHRQGAGDSVYFCPAGVEVHKTIRGGGCGACAAGATESPAPLAAGAAGIGLLGVALLGRRRRRSRSTVPRR